MTDFTPNEIALLMPLAMAIDPAAFKPGCIVIYDPLENMQPNQRAALESAFNRARGR